MNVWIVKTTYYMEGCGKTVKGFFDEHSAEEFKDSLEDWLKRKPDMYSLVVRKSKDEATDEEWEAFNVIEDVWQAEYPGVSSFADGFVVEKVDVVDTRLGFHLKPIVS